MRKMLTAVLFLTSLALPVVSAAQSHYQDTNYGQPVTTTYSVSFPDSSATFQPSSQQATNLDDVRDAAMVIINGRTSTLRPSARDEALALARAKSARSWLIARGVSPLKIMINYASAADFIADNSTAEGRYLNQRVDIEVFYVPQF